MVHAPSLRLIDVSLEGGVIERSVLWNLSMGKVAFMGVQLVSVSMNESRALGLTMHDCKVTSTRMRFMQFASAKLEGTTFYRCAFEGVDLSSSSVEGTRFLIPSHSETTVWPEGHEPGTEPLPE